MEELQERIVAIISKIRHYLITTMGKTLDDANDNEIFRALCWSLREEILINWAACNHTYAKKNARRVFYISMEYMPGKFLGNNVTNISDTDLIRGVAKALNKEVKELLGCESEIGIGNGGLGRLASCLLDSIATCEYPAIGYGMRYQYGIFEQHLIHGLQVERPDCWLLHENPWEFRRDTKAVNVYFGGELKEFTNSKQEKCHELTQYEEVRALPFDYPIVGYSAAAHFPVTTLRIWSTKESPRNFSLQRYNAGDTGSAAENTSLTDVLYPNDNNDTGKRIRLKQEFLLVSASLQDIINEELFFKGHLRELADSVRIQINDTHPSLAVVELIRILTHHYDYSYEEAFDLTKTVCSYTNHTVLKEALEEWNVERIKQLLPRQYLIIERMHHDLNKAATKHFGDGKSESHTPEKVQDTDIIRNQQIRMANLTIYATHKTNGVAALHSKLIQTNVFPAFYSLFPERFTNVTNGVTQRRWLLNANPQLADFISKRIGTGWIKNFEEIAKLKDYANDQDSLKELQAIKKANKQRLIDTFAPRLTKSHSDIDGYTAFLGVDALFDIQIKRIHEYKRQFMAALHTLMLYHDIADRKKLPAIKRMVIFSGKAAPGYDLAKCIILFIHCIMRKIQGHSEAKDLLKVAFLENYNVTNAEVIIPGADLSEQISTASTEASGTGNMKLTMNGALTIGTNDGANVEMREEVGSEWWPFLFGAEAEENLAIAKNQSHDPRSIADNNDAIKKATDALIDGSLAVTEKEHIALEILHSSLFEGVHGGNPDRYFVLNDIEDYYSTQKKVEELYLDKDKWTQYCIRNIAGMGKFSTDRSIRDYANNIWDVQPCPVDQAELEHVRKEYREADKCRITKIDS